MFCISFKLKISFVPTKREKKDLLSSVPFLTTAKLHDAFAGTNSEELICSIRVTPNHKIKSPPFSALSEPLGGFTQTLYILRSVQVAPVLTASLISRTSRHVLPFISAHSAVQNFFALFSHWVSRLKEFSREIGRLHYPLLASQAGQCKSLQLLVPLFMRAEVLLDVVGDHILAWEQALSLPARIRRMTISFLSLALFFTLFCLPFRRSSFYSIYRAFLRSFLWLQLHRNSRSSPHSAARKPRSGLPYIAKGKDALLKARKEHRTRA